MGLFDIFKKKANTTAVDDGTTDQFYNLLFCDDLNLYQAHNTQSDNYPWNVLFNSAVDIPDLYRAATDEELESRVRILAYNKLLSAGEKPANKELLGVIVEVGLETGTDVLASYKDGRGRYINQSGKIIIWETRDDTSNQLTDSIFKAGEVVSGQIGVWDKQRRPKPGQGTARLTLLRSDGLCFGEAPINVFFNDALAGPVLSAAAQLMKYFIEQVAKQ
jgi:hypothetical protein